MEETLQDHVFVVKNVLSFSIQFHFIVVIFMLILLWKKV